MPKSIERPKNMSDCLTTSNLLGVDLEHDIEDPADKLYLDLYSSIAHALAGCKDVDMDDVTLCVSNVIKVFKKASEGKDGKVS